MEYIPQAMHKAIRWNYRDPLNEPEVEDLLWQIVQGASNNNKLENGLTKVVHVPKKNMFIPAQGSIPTKVSGMVLVDWAFPTQTRESIEEGLLGLTHK